MSEKVISLRDFLEQANRTNQTVDCSPMEHPCPVEQPIAPEEHRLPQQSVQIVGYSALDSEGAYVDVMAVSTTSVPTTNFVCDSNSGVEVLLTPENQMFSIELGADSAEQLAQCLTAYSQSARQINTAFEGVERMNANASEN